MADQIIQLPADSTGKKVDTSELTVGTNTVERERVNIGDPTAAAGLAAVTNADPVSSSYGVVARLVGTVKGTQGATGTPVQDLKDAGRTVVVIYLDAVAGITTEALATLNINKGGTVTSTATQYTVTTGKTLRILYFGTSVKNTSTVATNSRIRLRSGPPTLAVTSAIFITNECGTAAAVANVTATDDTNMAEGLEIAAGQQVGISHVESATTSTVSACLIGYEY